MALMLKDLDQYVHKHISDVAIDGILNSSPIFTRLQSNSLPIQASPYVPEGTAFLMNDHGIQSVITHIGPAEPEPIPTRPAPGIRKLDLPKA